MLILDLRGISFHAVVVFGLGKNNLFKSILGRCVLWYQMSKEAFPICMDGYVPIMSNGTKDLNQEEKCPTIRLPRLYNLGKTILSSRHCAIYYPVLKMTFSHYSNLY